jgi:hypothetical protein
MNSFDGTGKPYRGASYRALILVLIVCLVGVALVWLAYSAALNVDPGLAPDPSQLVAPAP